MLLNELFWLQLYLLHLLILIDGKSLHSSFYSQDGNDNAFVARYLQILSLLSQVCITFFHLTKLCVDLSKKLAFLLKDYA